MSPKVWGAGRRRRAQKLGTARLVQPKQTAAELIEAALTGKPVTVDEVCMAVYGQCGERERNAVHQRIHRLTAQKRLRKHAMRYELIK